MLHLSLFCCDKYMLIASLSKLPMIWFDDLILLGNLTTNTKLKISKYNYRTKETLHKIFRKQTNKQTNKQKRKHE